MIVNRLTGGCLAAISFILLGLVLSTRVSSTTGIQVMDRLGLSFALLFLAVQFVIGLIFLRPRELMVPLLLFAGGTLVYGLVTSAGGGLAEAGGIPLHHALFAGASFSGLATGALVMMDDHRS